MSHAPPRLSGLIAATFTPMHADGAINLGPVPEIVDRLCGEGVRGLYVCGSTGEGPSLTNDERKQVAVAYRTAAAGRIPVVVQVGHNSVAAACDLAKHAEAVGADAISAVLPSYFPVADLSTLVETMAEMAAAAPATPFYYYHIPHLSGLSFDASEIMAAAAERVPTLVGIKFSHPRLDELQRCLALDGGRLEVLFGVDEMLLGAWATGCQGAVGSTYNFLAPLSMTMLERWVAGDLTAARECQARAVAIIREIVPRFGLGGLKAAMAAVGPDCGPPRLPLKRLDEADKRDLLRRLAALGLPACATAAARG